MTRQADTPGCSHQHKRCTDEDEGLRYTCVDCGAHLPDGRDPGGAPCLHPATASGEVAGQAVTYCVDCGAYRRDGRRRWQSADDAQGYDVVIRGELAYHVDSYVYAGVLARAAHRAGAPSVRVYNSATGHALAWPDTDPVADRYLAVPKQHKDNDGGHRP